MLKTNLHKYSLANYTLFWIIANFSKNKWHYKKKDRKLVQTIFNIYYNVIVWRPKKKNVMGKDG